MQAISNAYALQIPAIEAKVGREEITRRCFFALLAWSKVGKKKRCCQWCLRPLFCLLPVLLQMLQITTAQIESASPNSSFIHSSLQRPGGRQKRSCLYCPRERQQMCSRSCRQSFVTANSCRWSHSSKCWSRWEHRRWVLRGASVSSVRVQTWFQFQAKLHNNKELQRIAQQQVLLQMGAQKVLMGASVIYVRVQTCFQSSAAIWSTSRSQFRTEEDYRAINGAEQ